MGKGIREERRRIDHTLANNRPKIRVFLLGGGGEAANLRRDVQTLLETDYHIIVMEEEPDEPDGDPFKKFERILRERRPTHYFLVFLNNESPNPGPQMEIMGLFKHHNADSTALSERTTIFFQRGWPRRGLSAYTQWFLPKVKAVEFELDDEESPLEELIAGRIDALAYDF